jgi:hypothetical protein
MAKDAEFEFVTDPDPDADTSKADRGDKVESPAAVEKDDKVDDKATDKGGARKRGPDGKFLPVDGAETEEEEETEEEDEEESTSEVSDDAETEEETEEEEETPDPKAAKPEKTVPYSRFKEVVDQRKEMGVKLAQTESELVKATAKDKTEIETINASLDKLYEDVEKARADGDVAQAAKLQREIDTNNRKISRIETQLISRQEAFALSENNTYNFMLEQMEGRVPQVNPESPEFDKTVVAELEFQVGAYEKAGLSPTAALRRACALLFQQDVFGPVPAAAAAKGPQKKPTDVKKNLEAARKSPPEPGSKGPAKEPAAKSVEDMTDEEFEALPESKRRELRGDNFAG